MDFLVLVLTEQKSETTEGKPEHADHTLTGVNNESNTAHEPTYEAPRSLPVIVRNDLEPLGSLQAD